MLIDTHAHLNFKDFDKDREEVIKRCLENDIWLINASSTFSTSKLAVEIAEKYPKGVYASVGLHPIHVKDEDFDRGKYRDLAKSDKVVAIGETGLDYLYPEREKQKDVFLRHLELAKELNLPVIFHCRKAHDDLLEILKLQVSSFRFQGVIHCFTGDWLMAEKFLAMGFYLGFNGIIFKLNLDDIIKRTPLDKMLIETDCPFLVPPLPADFVGRRSLRRPKAEALAKAGQVPVERNEPLYVKYVVQRIAELRNEPFEKIAQATTQNAKELFKF